MVANNLTLLNRTHDPVHQLTAVGGTSLTHDAKGNITTNVNAQTYVWDFDNRMSSVNSGAYGYTYDALEGTGTRTDNGILGRHR